MLFRSHFHRIIGMVGDCHELGQRGTDEQAVVWHGDVCHIKHEVLRAVLLLHAEGDGQLELTQGVSDAWVHPLVRSRRLQLLCGDLQFIHQLDGYEVEARSFVHQHLGHHDIVDDGGRHQGEDASPRAVARVVRMIKGDRDM